MNFILLSFRRNRKLFYIHSFPSSFVDFAKYKEAVARISPLAFLKLGEASQSAMKRTIYEADIIDWIARPFEPLFTGLITDPAVPETNGMTPE